MGTWLDRNRGLVFGVMSILAVVGAGVFYWSQPGQSAIEIVETAPTEAATATPVAAPTATPTPAPVRVYVSGAVQQSDVFFLPPGSIIKDAVQAAGGFTATADRAKINLALELQDQQQIHVPELGEENVLPVIQGGVSPQSQPAAAAASAAGAGSGRINLNTASLAELDTLPGIGPAIAQRVIDFRESAGGFTSPDQIKQVSGIGEATFAKIADLITVE